MLLERLLAHRVANETLELHLIDPHPAGAGRIWRSAQSPLLRLNSTAQDVTIFADETSTLAAPPLTGPSLAQWAQRYADGTLSPRPVLHAALAERVRALRPTDFPDRVLHSAYLDWSLRRVLAAHPEADIRFHADTVLSATATAHGERVTLASGAVLDVDAVAYTVGHTDAEPTREEAARERLAARHGLSYHRPAATADHDYSDLRAGETVLVRGLGLAAVDLVVLLTEGRGGVFEELPGGKGALRYLPSGREPRLLLGSRRGVPYRSKSTQELSHPPHPLSVFTPARLAEAHEAGERWNFLTDAYPLIATELLLAHYRELFEHHPERTQGTWENLEQRIRSERFDDPALRAALHAAVPAAVDRFHPSDVAAPLTGLTVATLADLDTVLRQHIETDLAQHTDQEHTATLAVWHALLHSHYALAGAPSSLWDEESRLRVIPRVWQDFFSSQASGPPPVRLRQFLALQDAGVLGYLGPRVSVSLEETANGRVFRATSPSVAEAAEARALVDAWLPGTDVQRTANPALRNLAAEAALEAGRIKVEAASGRVLASRGDGPDGPFLGRRWALGAPTSTPDAGAFTRPGIDALPFRSTDAAAVDLLAALRGGTPIPSADQATPATATP